MPFAALFLATHLIASSAGGVPRFDVAKSCKEEADDATAVTSCIRDENEARDQLQPEWSSFNSTDRTTCSRETSEDGTPSYVELLTCLEMARDARKLRNQ